MDVSRDARAGTFEPADLVVSYSSIAHKGLGRFGDPLDPDGDVSAMAQSWCMLRPGGLALIGLPMTCTEVGEIEFNAHRIYGIFRLALLARGFEFVGFDAPGCAPYLPSRGPQPIMILRKPIDGVWAEGSAFDSIAAAVAAKRALSPPIAPFGAAAISADARIASASGAAITVQGAPPQQPLSVQQLSPMCASTFSHLLGTSNLSAVAWPPPCPAPPHLVSAFEARGSMPISRNFCFAQRHEGSMEWSEAYLEAYRVELRSGRLSGTYTPEIVQQVRNALHAVSSVVAGGRAVVIGTERPWIEAILLDEGARDVLIFEYGSISTTHPRVTARPCWDIARDALAGAFEPADLVVSYSSIEHSGLGRYGDPLDPDGDVSAMAQSWCMLRPGGLALIGLPMTCTEVGEIEFNAHRIYGIIRLALLARGFEFVGFDAPGCAPYLPSRGPQPIMILRKPIDGVWAEGSAFDAIALAITAQQRHL